MTSGKNIVTFSSADLEARRKDKPSATDLRRVRAKSEEDLNRDIAADPDFSSQDKDWYLAAEVLMPSPKKLLSLRLDSDVVDWFKRQGPGYQTRMNAVLRAFIQQADKKRA
jgi:uncharacterized protein (DUF4415 family)